MFVAVAAVAVPASVQLNDLGLERMDQGDFEGSVAAFSAARRSEPDNVTLRRNHALALNSWAIRLGDAGQCDEAVQHLQEALELEPDEAAIALNLAVCRINLAHRQTQDGRFRDAEQTLIDAYETAPADEERMIDRRRADNFTLEARATNPTKTDKVRRLLEKALEIDPDCVAALVELGRLRYGAGESVGALDLWFRADELDNDIPGLGEHIEKVAREALTELEFKRRSSSHFSVSYEGAQNEVAAAEVLRILDRAWYEIGSELKYRPPKRTLVVLYTPKQYGDTTEAPHWSGGLFDGKLRIPLGEGNLTNAQLERLRTTLYHEYTHAVVTGLAGVKIPDWFNEGLAMYYELPPLERRKRYDRDNDHIGDLIRADNLPSIADLPERFSKIGVADEASRAYQIARTFTYWLADKYGAYKFKLVLSEVGEGDSFEEAIAGIYHDTLDRLESRWRRSF